MRRAQVKGVEAVDCSQAPCPVQQATRGNRIEVENGGVPITVDAASENGKTCEMQDVVIKVELEGQ